MELPSPSTSQSSTGHKLDLLSQLLNFDSSILSEPISEKYPALLEVPFISETELLLTRQVGSGSFGHVYHGILFSQDVAVKRLTVRNFTDELDFSTMDETDEIEQKAIQVAKTLHALEKEVSIMKGLRFVNIVQFYGVCLKPAAIVTQYCSKGSLFDLIGNARSISRVAKELTWKRRLQLAMDAAIGMNYLHSRMDPVLHRDLKSPNLLVDEYFNCKVADFNTSCFIDQTIMTDSIQANNPRWMAPEVASGSPFTKAADVYPFGIILWELMTWKEPFESDNDTLRTIQILTLTVRDGYRPEIIPNDKLQGGPCPVYDDYLKLMKHCWHQDPDERPSFKEIIERLSVLMTSVVQLTESGSPTSTTKLLHQVSRVPRQTSPEPQPTQSPRNSSPFSRPPSSQVTKELSSTEGTHDASVELSQGEETFSCSPFMNGPPPSETDEVSDDIPDNHLEHPPSFARWSSQIEETIENFRDEEQAEQEEVSEGRKRWNYLRSEVLQIEPTRTLQHQHSSGIVHWDALRTLIFGERESDRFIEKFSKFVLGDESELTKKVANALNQSKISVGVRVLEEMMKLKEEEARKERDRWTIVKHLMLENLKPTPCHPLWRLLAKKLKDPLTEMETLKPSEEQKETSNETEPPALSKGKALWRKVQVAFNLVDYSPFRPLKSPYWHILRTVLFQVDDNEEDEEEATSDSPHPPKSTPTAPDQSSETVSSHQGNKIRNMRAVANWNRARKTLDLQPISFWDRNKQFLQKFSQTQHPEATPPDTPLHYGDSKPKSRGWQRVRKLLIVDEEPPSEDKWQFVRDFLLENDFGHDWQKLSNFVQSHPQPPRDGRWELFRRLFFENRSLREQSQWSFLKDLFLKRDN
eukprot:g5632.t1